MALTAINRASISSRGVSPQKPVSDPRSVKELVLTGATQTMATANPDAAKPATATQTPPRHTPPRRGGPGGTTPQ